jgi:hypothetical protein
MPVQLALFKREGFRNGRIERSDFSVSKVDSEMSGLDAIHSDCLPDSFFSFEKHKRVIALLLNFAAGAIVVILQDYQVTKLFGLGHVFWAFAFVCILQRWQKGNVQFSKVGLYAMAYKGWLPLAILTLTTTLVFDSYDLVMYATGMRMTMVEYYNQ